MQLESPLYISNSTVNKSRGKCGLLSNERINAKTMKRQLVYSKYFLWIDCETFETTRIYIFNNVFI